MSKVFLKFMDIRRCLTETTTIGSDFKSRIPCKLTKTSLRKAPDATVDRASLLAKSTVLGLSTGGVKEEDSPIRRRFSREALRLSSNEQGTVITNFVCVKEKYNNNQVIVKDVRATITTS